MAQTLAPGTDPQVLSQYTRPTLDISTITPYVNIAIDGPAASGKTYTSLLIAHYLIGLDPEEIKRMSDEEYRELQKQRKIIVIDTERQSIRKYGNRRRFGFVFHAVFPTDFLHSGLREAVKGYERAGYELVLIDSFSHYWIGNRGVLDMVDQVNQGSRGSGWREVSPREKEMWDALLLSKMHVIVTMRSKMEYVYHSEVDPVTGRTKMTGVEKIGLAPVQRGEVPYEFDINITMDASNTALMSKVRGDYTLRFQGRRFNKPTGKEIAAYVTDWLFGTDEEVPEEGSDEQEGEGE